MQPKSTRFQHWSDARKVCVIGAGTMGSGIAAHLANIGFEVTILDLSNESVHQAFNKALQSKPSHFYASDTPQKVRLGSIRENLEWVSEADWVCEAIIEKLDAKQALFQAIEPLLKPDAMISTNTSGLQIALLGEVMSQSMRERFVGTHFFNPPRYLKLLELIPTADTAPDALEAITRFLEDRVARRVVQAKDTPGFIANRFGMWAMIHAIHTAENLRLSIEQVDAITGPFLGRPRSASFRLNDLVGLDIMQDIAQNLYDRCHEDIYRENLRTPASLAILLERGWIGEKTSQGYYRKEGKEFFALDLNTMAYRVKQDASFPSLNALAKLPLSDRIAKALELRDEAGEFLRNHLVPVLRYADYLKEEISHNVLDFDRVMKWGFGWEMGPFELSDAIGLSGPKFYQSGEMRTFSGGYTPIPAEPQYATVQDFPVIGTGEGYNLRDLGDGVKAICTTTKMGVFSPNVVHSLITLLQSDAIDRFVLTSEARSYSAGFDLKFIIEHVEAGEISAILSELAELQQLGLLLRSKPGVAAVFGHCLGGGFEMAMSCSILAAHPETQIGLPESKAGLLPSGGGVAMMHLRGQDSAKGLVSIACNIAQGVVSTSADDARRLGYLRETDVTVYHPDRLLFEAKKLALTAEVRPLAKWKPVVGPFVGMLDQAFEDLRAKGSMTDYDVSIADKVKAIIAKCQSFDDALRKEREEFADLCTKALTQARIRHILETGKPMKN